MNPFYLRSYKKISERNITIKNLIRDKAFQRKERILEKIRKSSEAGTVVEVEDPATLENANQVNVEERGDQHQGAADMEEDEPGSLNVVGRIVTNPNLAPDSVQKTATNYQGGRGSDKKRRKRRHCSICLKPGGKGPGTCRGAGIKKLCQDYTD